MPVSHPSSRGNPHVHPMHLRSHDTDSGDEDSDEQLSAEEDRKKLYPELPKNAAKGHLYPKLSQHGADETDSSLVRQRSTAADGVRAFPEAKRHADGFKRENPRGMRRDGRESILANLPVKVICPVCLLALFLLMSLLYKFGNNTVEGKPGAMDHFQIFKEKINSLASAYPAQDPDQTWRVIKAASREVLLQADPEDPMILLLATPKGAEHLGTCLARQLARTFSDTRGAPVHAGFYLDAKKLRSDSSSPAQEKLRLDEGLQVVFSERGHAAVLDGLQALSGTAALMLHAYCDNGNAPFRNVMMVFVVNLDDPAPPSQSSVEDFFHKHWSADIGTTGVGSLMVRIANNLVSVKPEPGFVSTQC